MLEYALLLACIALIAVAGIGAVGDQVHNKFKTAELALEGGAMVDGGGPGPQK